MGRQGDFKKKIESEEILKESPPVRFEPTIPRMSAGRSTCVATESLDEKWPHFTFYKLNMPFFKPLYAFVCLSKTAIRIVPRFHPKNPTGMYLFFML